MRHHRYTTQRGAAAIAARVAPLILIVSAATSAQQPSIDFSSAPGDSTRVETRHLTAVTSVDTAAQRDGQFTLVVDVHPKPKMHVYAPGQKDVMAVSLQLDRLAGVRGGPTRYPKPESYFFAPLAETQIVYSKPFRVTHAINIRRPTSTVRPEVPATVTGTLRYQACDDAVCYVPQTVRLTWRLPPG